MCFSCYEDAKRFESSEVVCWGGGPQRPQHPKKSIFSLSTEMLSFISHDSLALLSTLIVLYFPPKIFLIPLELVDKIVKNRQKICKIWLGGPHFWILGGPPKYESGGFETTKCTVESIISLLHVTYFFVVEA